MVLLSLFTAEPNLLTLCTGGLQYPPAFRKAKFNLTQPTEPDHFSFRDTGGILRNGIAILMSEQTDCKVRSRIPIYLSLPCPILCSARIGSHDFVQFTTVIAANASILVVLENGTQIAHIPYNTRRIW